MDDLWATASGSIPENDRPAIVQKVRELQSLVAWFKENNVTLPAMIASQFNWEATQILEANGYLVKLDPGEMPS